MNFMMIGMELRRNPPREWSFIELLVVERRAKRTKSRCRQKLSGGARNRGGIDPTRKKCSDGNIATQANSYSLPHALANLFHGLLDRRSVFISIFGELWRPEPGGHDGSAAAHTDRLARPEFPNSP